MLTVKIICSADTLNKYGIYAGDTLTIDYDKSIAYQRDDIVLARPDYELAPYLFRPPFIVPVSTDRSYVSHEIKDIPILGRVVELKRVFKPRS
jgi:hypothetical protein